jgi:hypothetical protein
MQPRASRRVIEVLPLCCMNFLTIRGRNTPACRNSERLARILPSSSADFSGCRLAELRSMVYGYMHYLRKAVEPRFDLRRTRISKGRLEARCGKKPSHVPRADSEPFWAIVPALRSTVCDPPRACFFLEGALRCSGAEIACRAPACARRVHAPSLSAVESDATRRFVTPMCLFFPGGRGLRVV